MDTSDLSAKAYKAIIIEAERFNPDLTIYYGLLSSQCNNEAMFIKMAEKLTRPMLKYGKDEIDDMFFGEPPVKKEFHIALYKILENISKLEKSTFK